MDLSAAGQAGDGIVGGLEGTEVVVMTLPDCVVVMSGLLTTGLLTTRLIATGLLATDPLTEDSFQRFERGSSRDCKLTLGERIYAEQPGLHQVLHQVLQREERPKLKQVPRTLFSSPDFLYPKGLTGSSLSG